MRHTAFIDFDICHWMSPLRKLYYVTLTYFSNKIFRMQIYLKRWKLAHKARYVLQILLFTIDWHQCECYNEWCRFYRFWYLLLNGAVAKVVFRYLDLLLKVKYFKYLRNRKSYHENVSYFFHRFRYLPSNGAIAKVVLRDLVVLFQCYIWNSES